VSLIHCEAFNAPYLELRKLSRMECEEVIIESRRGIM
jgi:hypothetical protein